MRFFFFTRIASPMGKTPTSWGKKPALGWPAHAQIFLIITIRILLLYRITRLNVVSVIRVSDEYRTLLKLYNMTDTPKVQTYITVEKHT